MKPGACWSRALDRAPGYPQPYIPFGHGNPAILYIQCTFALLRASHTQISGKTDASSTIWKPGSHRKANRFLHMKMSVTIDHTPTVPSQYTLWKKPNVICVPIASSLVTTPSSSISPPYPLPLHTSKEQAQETPEDGGSSLSTSNSGHCGSYFGVCVPRGKTSHR